MRRTTTYCLLEQDPALMRPGRLDRILYVGPPDRDGREEIIKIRTKQMKVEEGLDIPQIATLVSYNIPYNAKTILILILADGWLFWGGNIGALSRGCFADDAARYECTLRECFPYLQHPVELDLLSKVPQEAFIAAAKSMQRQITPSMLHKFQSWREQSGLQAA